VQPPHPESAFFDRRVETQPAGSFRRAVPKRRAEGGVPSAAVAPTAPVDPLGKVYSTERFGARAWTPTERHTRSGPSVWPECLARMAGRRRLARAGRQGSAPYPPGCAHAPTRCAFDRSSLRLARSDLSVPSISDMARCRRGDCSMPSNFSVSSAGRCNGRIDGRDRWRNSEAARVGLLLAIARVPVARQRGPQARATPVHW
jgi:hypothetical protein